LPMLLQRSCVQARQLAPHTRARTELRRSEGLRTGGGRLAVRRAPARARARWRTGAVPRQRGVPEKTPADRCALPPPQAAATTTARLRSCQRRCTRPWRCVPDFAACSCVNDRLARSDATRPANAAGDVLPGGAGGAAARRAAGGRRGRADAGGLVGGGGAAGAAAVQKQIAAPRLAPLRAPPGGACARVARHGMARWPPVFACGDGRAAHPCAPPPCTR
jgi:hypothetical protein